jgi:hypothetical protein
MRYSCCFVPAPEGVEELRAQGLEEEEELPQVTAGIVQPVLPAQDSMLRRLHK